MSFFLFFFFFFFFFSTAPTEDSYPLEADAGFGVLSPSNSIIGISTGTISIIAVSKFPSGSIGLVSIGLVSMGLVSIGPVWFGSVLTGSVVVLPMAVSLLS